MLQSSDFKATLILRKPNFHQLALCDCIVYIKGTAGAEDGFSDPIAAQNHYLIVYGDFGNWKYRDASILL